MYKDIAGFIGGYKGVKLFYKAWVKDENKARIIFLHGSGEYSEKYTRFAEWFFDKNIDVFIPDLRGHGRSAGSVCHVDNFNEYTFDLDIFVNFVDKAWTSDKKTFLVSHSLGGLIAIFYALNFSYSFKGIVLCSPCLKLKLKIEHVMAWLANIFYKILGDRHFSSHIKPMMATHDKYILERFMKDPLIHHVVTASFYVQMLNAMRYVKERTADFKRPFLFLQPGDDKICDINAADDFYKRSGSVDKEYKLYPGFYHELLNEIDREIVYGDIYNWITKRC